MRSLVDTVCAAAGVLALLCTSAAQANCYAVYKGNDRIYYSQTPPVDTSLHYSDTVPARFGPGATMVVASGYDCPVDDESQWSDTATVGNAGAARMGRPKDDDVLKRSAALNRLAQRNGVTEDAAAASEGSRAVAGSMVSGQGPVYTGPRGGQFYYNSSGNKTYVSSGSGSSSSGRRR